MLLFAGTAAATGYVEGDGDQIPYLEVFHPFARLDDFSSDFMAQYETLGGCSTATHHVLVGATDVGGDDSQDHTVVDLTSLGRFHFGEGNVLYFDFSSAQVDDASIA